MKVISIGKGQILVEILLVIFMFSLALLIVYQIVRSNIYLSENYFYYKKALDLGNNEFERLRDLAKTDFFQITNTTTQKDIFSIRRDVIDLDQYTKKVTLNISWNLNKPSSLSLTAYLVDYKHIPVDNGLGGANGGGGSGLAGDWSHPTTLSSIDLGPGNAGTDVNVKFNTVYISSVASDYKKPDLFIIDVTNPSSPSIKSSINTGKGANSLSINGNYVFLANNDTSNQLQIVDISNEFSPRLISSTTLPSNSSIPLSIFAFKNYVVITTANSSSGNEVFIYDVSQPQNPQYISSLNFDTDINDSFVLRDRLYLAGDKIYIYNIATPTAPSLLLSGLPLPNNEKIYSIFPVSYNLLLAGGNSKLYFIDTSDLNHPIIISSYNAYGQINDIYARENLAFLATSNSNNEFQIVNYSSLNNPILYSSYNFPQNATGIDYRNNLIFVSVRSNDALRIITSQ